MSIYTIIGIGAVGVILALVKITRKRRRDAKARDDEQFERIRPLYEKLENGQLVTKDDVLPYAADIRTRTLAFAILKHYGNTSAFPPEYYSMEMASESQLANWLEFPTELDASPDEIEHIKRVTIDFDGNKNFIHYEVLKYKMNEPHWAAKYGWMLGVVGPFFDDSKPYDNAMSTFSRIDSTIDKVTPEEEVKWVHENISLRKR